MRNKSRYPLPWYWTILSMQALLLMALSMSAQRPIPMEGAEQDPKKWVVEKWATLDLKDVSGRHMLMDIARDYGMVETMRKLANEILAIDPDHREAHRHLNHTLFQGKWLSREEAETCASLIRFDYEFPPGYKFPRKDRLLFPLYLVQKEHKKHVKHQEWTNHWIYKRKPLTLHSNCTYGKVERFARTFKEFAKYVSKFLGLRLSSNYEINIYRSQEEYYTVGRAPRGTGGYYRPGARKLYFYDDPRDQISTYRVLFHEGTHMIVHLTCKNKAFHYPICINEGLAEYMAAARWDYYNKKYTFGHPLNDRIKQFKRLLAAGRARPLIELVPQGRRGFGGSEYAQAWALITYLCDEQAGHSPKKVGLYLKRLHKDNKYYMLRDGDPKKQKEMQRIFEKTFFNSKDGETWEAYQEKFWDYARKMKEEVGAPDFSRRYRRRSGFSNRTP